jgi:hypothetical protein
VARSQPFNGKLAEGGKEEDYVIGDLDYGVLCGGMIFRGAPTFEVLTSGRYPLEMEGGKGYESGQICSSLQKTAQNP